MKKLYWRPQKISLKLLWLIALVALAGFILTERYSFSEKQPYYEEKIKAAKLAEKAFDLVKAERIKRGYPIDIESDPLQSGLIGELLTPVTTNPGHLPAKQTSINPNFAAVIVHMLKRAGVEEGMTVAIGLSGSFPALNICTLAAVKTLGLRPIIITSVGSSQWGANLPNFMWLDMESYLYEQRVFPYKSVAVSRGGIDDRALGLPRESRKMLDDVIARSGVSMMQFSNYDESVELRMSIYREYSEGKDIMAYINVGGGTTSVGGKVGKVMFKPGLNRTMPKGSADINSVMTRFAIEDVPVIHLTKIDVLAERYGLPLIPLRMPIVGEGSIFVKESKSMPMVAGLLVLIFILLIAIVRLDWGYRMISSSKRDKPSMKPERMV